MLRRLFTPITMAFLSGGLLFPSLRATESNNTATAVAAQPNGPSVPFTHFARVPAGADLSTIRFEKVRLVNVPTRIRYSTDAGYCLELTFRDPGGSIACPSIEREAAVLAYEVTYSFVGQPLAADEYAGRNFSFSVYFEPNELDPEAQKALAIRRMSRSDAASYFAMSMHRETETRVAMDPKRSSLCEGNYADGMWVQADLGCKDAVSYTAVPMPSDYITVKVDAASARGGIVAAK